MKMQKLWNREQSISIQMKLVMLFIMTSIIFFGVNMFMYININSEIGKIDQVYMSNVMLNDLTDSLSDIQGYMVEYLNTKSSDSIEDYYRSEQEYRKKLENLNGKANDSSMGLMEKNIRNLSESYMELTEETVQGKRGRMIEKYKVSYENATSVFEYINTYIYSLNNEQFKYNSGNYNALLLSFKSLEIVTFTVLIIVTITNVILSILLTKSITRPLSILSEAANEIGAGNFSIGLIEVNSRDEIGVVTMAFNKMIVSIQDYIEKIKERMEIESAMKEKELMMETHLKDAELRYLQAQINPHFLFNTLNAGAQLAMLEEADRTYKFIQNMAAFFRYSIKKDKNGTTLADEIRLVDNYIYILNVRFSGDIHFQKEIEEEYIKTQVPSMILQPIVENAINYGVRDIAWSSLIKLKVYQEDSNICVSISDNGIGMSQEKIEEVMKGQIKEEVVGDSNGVGLNNVINRLRLFYDKEHVLEIFSDGKDKGTQVVIYLPMN